MIEWFSLARQKEIGAQLDRLGFQNPDLMLKNSDEADDPRDKDMKAVIAWELKINAESEADLLFIIKENKDESWQIDTILARVQLFSERFEEGMTYVSNKYELKNGPLPDKEEIRKEIIQKVKIENAKDFLYLHKDLDNEFKRLGFDKEKDHIAIGSSIGKFTFFWTRDKIDLPGGTGSESLIFHIGTWYNEERSKALVIAIFAALDRSTEIDGTKTLKAFDEKSYAMGNAPLPTKAEITAEFIQTELQRELIAKVMTTFNIGQNKQDQSKEQKTLKNARKIK
jgi:hypothetical protein